MYINFIYLIFRILLDCTVIFIFLMFLEDHKMRKIVWSLKKILKIKTKFIIYSFTNHNNFYFSESLWYLYDFFLRLLNFIVYFETKVTSGVAASLNCTFLDLVAIYICQKRSFFTSVHLETSIKLQTLGLYRIKQKKYIF